MASEILERRSLCERAAVAATSMLLLVGCDLGRPTDSADNDIAAVHTAIEGLTDAYVARDWDTFVGYFTDDAIWMPSGVPPLQGKNAWWEWVEPWWDVSTVVDIGVSTEELIVIEDWAIERLVEYQTARFGEAEEPASLYFKGIWIFRRQEDGSWKIARYIWNENPAPENERGMSIIDG